MEMMQLKVTGAGHEAYIHRIDASSDGMHVASVSLDDTVRVWDMRGNEAGKCLLNTGPISVAFFPDNRNLAVGSLDNSVSIVNWRVGILVEVLREHTGPCYSIDILPRSGKIVSASVDKSIVWSRQRPEFGYSIEKILAGHGVCAFRKLVQSSMLTMLGFRLISPRGRRRKVGNRPPRQ